MAAKNLQRTGASPARSARGAHAWQAAAAAVLLVAGVAGCAPRPPPAAQAVAAGAHAGATPYPLDGSASEIWLFLQPDGPLAKVGHNHVITARGLRGTVWLHPQPEQSGCEIELPVDSLVVDDPKERATAGGEFAEPIDDSAREGTREHMLGDRQLSAPAYPLVKLQCARMQAAADAMTVQLTVTLRDHVSQLAVPVRWQRSGNTLQASGEITFRQSSLGLEPYSLMLGALRVADEVRARFKLVARSS